jgi:cold shock CspA family protein
MKNIGKVLFFDKKGFGFIQPSCNTGPTGTEKIYFHASALPGKRGERSIADGQVCEYEHGMWKGQPCAINVQAIIAVDVDDDLPVQSPAATHKVGAL